MTPSDSLWHWVGWTAAAATLLLVLYAILGDVVGHRFRRRRRCPKCWYDLSHTPGMTCSECGYTAGREGQLLRWRRRWRVIALTPVLWIGVYLWLYVPEMRQHGWIAGVPTAVLVHFTPPPEREYTVEDFPGKGRDWRPHRVIAEIERRLKAGETPSPEQWRTLLTRAEFVWARDRWPIEVPFEVGLRMVRWTGSRIWIGDISVVGATGEVVHNLIHGVTPTEYEVISSYTFGYEHVPMQGVGLGTYRIKLPLHTSMTTNRTGMITTVNIPMTFVQTLDEAITPTSTPEIDALVREHLQPTILQYTASGVRWPWLQVDLSRIDDPRTRRMAVQVEVDVISHGVTIAERFVDLYAARFGPRRTMNLIVLDCVKFEDLSAAPQNYAIRIRGNGERALRDAKATHYWAGSITIPCTEIPIEVR